MNKNRLVFEVVLHEFYYTRAFFLKVNLRTAQ
jgi:hypothetical protein